MIYLDNASTTEVSMLLKQTILDSMFENYGNPSSVHSLGIKARNTVENAREQTAKLFHANAENIIFTSSGSEANTLAILGVADHLKKVNKTHILTTKYEHHSVLNTMKKMESLGFNVEYLNVPSGMVDVENFKKRIRQNTGLISIMYMNNELGTINNIHEMTQLCADKEIIFHTDCVQAAGFLSLDANELGADMISVSGHKIHAPKGVGCLYVKDKSVLSNIIFGGNQEFGLRAGTENVAYIAAFGKAAEFADEDARRSLCKIRTLSDTFFRQLSNICKNQYNNFGIYNNTELNLNQKVYSLLIKDVDADTLVRVLDRHGVCVSAGAACSSNSLQPSHALKAIGLSDEDAKSTIRISFSRYNVPAEACEAANIIVSCVSMLREMSPIKYF